MRQIATGIIIALLGSNILIGSQYIHDSKEYENELNKQKEVIKQYKVNKRRQYEQIKGNGLQINFLNQMIDQLKQQKQQLEEKLTSMNKVKSSPSPQSKQQVKQQTKQQMFEATAYTANCNGCSGSTFSGYSVKNTIEYNGLRIVAMDTSVVPLYSIVKIDTDSESFQAIVLDTGGAIKNNKLDLLVSTYDDAIRFGRKNAEITILREGKGDI